MATASNDGFLIASASPTGQVTVWDSKTGSPLRIIDNHAVTYLPPDFSPDGKLLALSSADKRNVWDVNAGTLHTSFEGCSGRIRIVRFSPDNNHLVAALTNSNLVRLCNLLTGEHYDLHGNWSTDGALGIAFSPDSQTLVISDPEFLAVWSLESHRWSKCHRGHAILTTVLAFSPDGKSLAAVGDEWVRIWCMNDKTAMGVPRKKWDISSFITFAPDGRSLAASYDQETNWLLIETGETRVVGSKTFSPRFSPDGKLLAGFANNAIRLVDSHTGSTLHVLPHHSASLSSQFSPGGQYLVSESDSTVKVWDTVTGALYAALTGSYVKSAFSPDGNCLAVRLQDGKIRLYITWMPALYKNFGCQSDGSKVVFAPNSTHFATVTSGHIIQLCDIMSGEFTSMVHGHADCIGSLAFSLDGLHLASSSNRSVRLWNVGSGALSWSVPGSSWGFSLISLSPTGTLLVTSDDVGTVRVWNIASGLIEQTHALGRRTRKLSFCSDGKYLQNSFGQRRVITSASEAATDALQKPVFQFTFDKRWLACNSRRMLWLPHKYNECDLGFHENIVAIMTDVGVPILLTVDSVWDASLGELSMSLGTPRT